MLKRKLIKKIYISTAALVSVFLLCLVPNRLYDLKVNKYIVPTSSNVKTIDVYLLSKKNKLSMVSVPITSLSIEDKAREIIKILEVDSELEGVIPSGFRGILPKTRINNLFIKDNILNIDFSSSFLNINKDMEELVIESLVYSLTSIDGVDGITIYVDGEIINNTSLLNKRIPSIITRDFGINKEYDITSLNDINHVTLYYIDKNSDDYYYVPVTKYLNDDREKIDIIIDELTSSNIYNTNLMSFLDSNTKLLNVLKENDIMELSFNNYILNDFEKKNILEEVLYSICLSIKDNYDVSEVIFYVENEEIYKSVLKSIE